MKDEKIFAQLIIERVKDNCKIEIEENSNNTQSNRYEAIEIPYRNTIEKDASSFNLLKNKEMQNVSHDNDVFAEIEIEGTNNIYKTDKIPQPLQLDLTQVKKENSDRDEKREIFLAMRDIARENSSSYFFNTRFYNKQTQYENSKIFYKQAQFMKDFEDDYDKVVPFSSYFPYYQSMNYEQLRTYFTWRTKLRKGIVENTSLSYAFVYIYELINNVGVESPADGLDKLVAFWNNYKIYDTTIEKYLIKWIKDYHIYYELPHSFKDFLLKNDLQGHYPEIAYYEADNNCDFQRLCAISKYNIKKSTFYNDEKQLVRECADFVINKLINIFLKTGLEFENLIFQTAKSKFDWIPFEGALFYQHLQQANRQIVLTSDEVYTYSQNKCTRSVLIARDSGKQLLAYIFKQMEAVLRKTTNYKYKITANLNMISTETLLKLGALCISIEKVVTDATLEYYSEKNKTVVSIDESVLNKIRIESLQTQEKLIIPESDFEQIAIFTINDEEDVELIATENHLDKNDEELHLTQQKQFKQNDIWIIFKNSLSTIELEALAIILKGDNQIKQFADNMGIMLEVLVDSINEKAFDSIGDNILEIDFSVNIYDDYRDKIINILT